MAQEREELGRLCRAWGHMWKGPGVARIRSVWITESGSWRSQKIPSSWSQKDNNSTVYPPDSECEQPWTTIQQIFWHDLSNQEKLFKRAINCRKPLLSPAPVPGGKKSSWKWHWLPPLLRTTYKTPAANFPWAVGTSRLSHKDQEPVTAVFPPSAFSVSSAATHYMRAKLK